MKKLIEDCVKYLKAYKLTNEGYLEEGEETHLQQVLDGINKLSQMTKTLQECVGYSLSQVIDSDIHISTQDNCSDKERQKELRTLVDLYEIEEPTMWKIPKEELERIRLVND